MFNADSTYVFFRDAESDAALDDLPAGSLADWVFWNTWRTRQDPYSVLERGDTLYLMRRATRGLVAELRVAHVTRTRYASLSDAAEQLDRAFLVDPEEASWSRRAPDEGWLLAFNCDVVRGLAIDTPPALQRLDRLGGHNGFVRWSRLPTASRRSLAAKLPSSATRPLALAPCPDVDALESRLDAGARHRRRVPNAISREVWLRDGEKCRQCGTSERPFHLDHIQPWSKGGESAVANLQVLCRSCNLSKGARTIGSL